MKTAAQPRLAAPMPSGAELSLAEAEFPHELLLENTVVGVCYLLDRRFLWANARMTQMFGYEPGQLVGESVRVLYSTQDDFEQVGDLYGHVSRDDGYTHERPLLRKNGEVLWCLISGRTIERGDPHRRSVWVLQDITDKKRAEDELRRANQRLEHTVERRTLNLRRSNQALREEIERRRATQALSVESREKYRALFRHMPLGVLVTNAEGEIVEINRTLQTYLGATARAAFDVLAQDASRVVAPDGGTRSLAALVHEHAKSAKSRRVDRFEIAWRSASGKLRHVTVVAAPMSGHGLGVAYALSDVTEQRRAREREHAEQAALAHAARLSLMGQMASALAHELGQPLNACQSYLGGLRHRLAEDLSERPELALALDKLALHLDQASDIIRNVRGFVSRHQPEVERVDLAALTQQTLALLQMQLRAAQVRVEQAPVATPALVRCHPVEIQQVLVNLLVNAIEAVQGLPPEQRVVEIAIECDCRGKASVQITDGGPGVEPALAERIFEPYFSTKATGLGMGLMICRTIVESHGGTLRLQGGRGGVGASFRFTLPVVREAPR